MKCTIFIVLLTLTIRAQGELLCYQCENCKNVSDEDLKVCGLDPSTTTTPDVTSTTTSSEEISTSTPSEEISTTTPSEEQSTTTPSEEQSTTTQSEETSTTTPSVEMSTTTSSEEPSTTTSSEEPSTTTQSGEPLTTMSSTEPSDEPSKAKPSIENASELLRNYGLISRQRREIPKIGYYCYIITIKGDDNSSDTVNRGCLTLPMGQEGCKYYIDENNIDEEKTEKCRICQNDACNSSSVFRLSTIAVIAMLIVQFLH